jgi:pimeloyl-ACP methyl ester carboxylesterase
MRTGSFAEVLGVRTHYIDVGEGRPLLLIHGGGPGNSAEYTWHRQIDALADRFRVIAFDELGFGQTGHAADGDGTLPARARHAAALLDALDLRDVALAGHSQGGFIATRLAIEQPDRVARLVICSTGTASPQGNFTPEGEFSPRVQDFISFSSDTSWERFLNTWLVNTWDLASFDQPLARSHYDHFLASGNLDAYVRGTERPLTADPAAFAGLYEREIAPHLATLRTPTAILWGREDDFAYPRRGYELFELLPDADMHLLSDCKHLLPWDRAEAFNELVTAFCSAS